MDLVDEATGAVVKTVQTDSLGGYVFNEVAEGTYTVREHQPAGYVDGVALAGTASTPGVAGTNEVTGIGVVTGEDAKGYDFLELVFGKVTMEKQGLDGTKLDGSGWALYEVGQNSVLTEVAGGMAADQAGGSTFTSADLKYGVAYRLVETKAPEGHELLPEPIAFELDRTDGIKMLAGDGAGVVTEVAGADGTHLVVRDVPRSELPFTGGSGAATLSLVSVLLLLVAGAWAARRRRGQLG